METVPKFHTKTVQKWQYGLYDPVSIFFQQNFSKIVLIILEMCVDYLML